MSANVYYQWDSLRLFSSELEEVLTVDGSYKFMYAINNQFPGPTLVVYENQIVSNKDILNYCPFVRP